MKTQPTFLKPRYPVVSALEQETLISSHPKKFAKSNAFTIFLFVLIFNSSSLAQSNSAVQYLIREPASLFDFGAYRLEKELETALAKDIIVKTNGLIAKIPSVRLAGNLDRIIVSIIMDADWSKDSPKKICELGLNRVKEKLGVDPKTGNVTLGRQKFMGSSTSDMGEFFFAHKGYSTKGQDKHKKQIDEITIIRVDAVAADKSAISCESKLRSTQILFSKATPP